MVRYPVELPAASHRPSSRWTLSGAAAMPREDRVPEIPVKTSLLDVAEVDTGVRVRVCDASSPYNGQMGSVVRWEKTTVHVAMDSQVWSGALPPPHTEVPACCKRLQKGAV